MPDSATSLSRRWGTTPEERLIRFPCDDLLERPDDVYWRGVTVRAPPDAIFRWLCQLRVAPYSYDWLDNFGRRSPRKADPALEALALGQTFMRIFVLVSFERPRHLTLRIKRATGIFGDVAVSYLVVPRAQDCSRLVAKLRVRYPRGPLGAIVRRALPWGDLVMMRRQLLTLKELAEG